MKSNKWFYTGLLYLVAGLSSAVKAQQLPLDKAVITGKLANGLTYIIRKNDYEKGRAYLSLVNKVGSVLETDNQQGLAHFMEHMNFNGTTHYPHETLVNFLQKAGVRFGADLNAVTSFDETIYQLPLPIDQPGMLKDGLQVLRDWAQGALLDGKEIDQERGVILEEKRQRAGVSSRINEKVFPILANNSRYSSRMPIGLEQVLKGFNHDTLRSFFRDWYRPDLQAVIVVGDVDVNQTKRMIEQLFGDLKNPSKEKIRTDYKIPLNGQKRFLAVTDDEQPQTTLQIIFKYPHHKLISKSDFKFHIVNDLFNQMLGYRLQDIGTENSGNYNSASAQYSPFIGDLDAFQANITVNDDKLGDGIKAFWSVISEINGQGFKESEFEMAKANYQAAIQAALKEANKNPSQSYAQEYTRLFLDNEASPGIEEESKLTNELLKTISNNDIKTFATEITSGKDRDVIITAPSTLKAKLPSEQQVDSWLTEAAKSNAKVNSSQVVSQGASISSAQEIAGGKVIAKSSIPELNVTLLTLSNGLKVILKPTEFKNDQVLFTGIGNGGSSVLPDQDFLSASLAPGIVMQSGLGNSTPAQLRAELNGKQIFVVPAIEERAAKISGSTSVTDLEIALRTIRLYMTSPRKDEQVFKAFKDKLKANLIASQNSPQKAYFDTLSAVLSNHNPRSKSISSEDIDKLDLDKCINTYKDRFSDASAFTFTFVGNFQPETITPLLEKYLGSLPATNRGEQALDLNNQIPKGVIQRTVYAGIENMTTVQLFLDGDYEYNPVNNMRLQALNDILNFRLLERLREKEGGVYSPRISISLKHSPKQQYAFSINFTCAPENSLSLIAAVWDEITKLKNNGPSKDDLLKSVKENKVQNSRSKMTNEYWLTNLSFKYQENLDPKSVLTYQTMLDELTTEQIQKDAQTYLNEKNYVRVLLMPVALKP